MRNSSLSPYNKSIAAAIVGALVMLMANYNIIISDELGNAIEVLLSALITGAIVWAAPKNTPGIR